MYPLMVGIMDCVLCGSGYKMQCWSVPRLQLRTVRYRGGIVGLCQETTLPRRVMLRSNQGALKEPSRDHLWSKFKP